jgi:cell division septum initiation protein DivIVA
MTRPATGPGRTDAEMPTEVSQRPTSSDTDTREFSRPQLAADPALAPSAVRGFGVSWRGYDRLEVDNYRSRVESELASTRTAYERAAQAHAQTTERLRAVQNDLGRVRSQLTNSPTALSDRLREILHLAEQDADQTRADARTEADKMRSSAVADTKTIVQQARETGAEIVNAARAEQQKLMAEAEQLHAAARQEIEDAHAEAAAHRTEADRHASEQREQADAAAASRIAEMTQQLSDLTRQRDEAIATLSRLHQDLAKALASTEGPPSEPPAASDRPPGARGRVG